MTVSISLPSQYPTGPPTLPRAVSASASQGIPGVVHPGGVLSASLLCPGSHGKKSAGILLHGKAKGYEPNSDTNPYQIFLLSH
jgi:hypothetical protein